MDLEPITIEGSQSLGPFNLVNPLYSFKDSAMTQVDGSPKAILFNLVLL